MASPADPGRSARAALARTLCLFGQGFGPGGFMPAAFHVFGREAGTRDFAGPNKLPYVQLTGSAALLLAVCPALGTAFGAQLLVAYATFLQLFRLFVTGDAQFLRAVYRTSLTHTCWNDT